VGLSKIIIFFPQAAARETAIDCFCPTERFETHSLVFLILIPNLANSILANSYIAL